MFFKKVLLTTSILLLGIIPFSKTNQAQEPNLIQQTWQNFDQLYADPNLQCPEEKTALPEMGLRGLYCHLKPKISYQKLQELAKVPIFIKGPHSPTALNLEAEYDFGYYNPEFVKWLHDQAIPNLTQNPAIVEATKPFYDKYIRDQVRSYYLVYLVINGSPRLKEAQKLKYLELIETKTLPPNYLQEQFREFADEFASKEFNWYETNTAGGFWIRRSIDGTDEHFIKVLDRLIEVYDPEF